MHRLKNKSDICSIKYATAHLHESHPPVQHLSPARVKALNLNTSPEAADCNGYSSLSCSPLPAVTRARSLLLIQQHYGHSNGLRMIKLHDAASAGCNNTQKTWEEEGRVPGLPGPWDLLSLSWTSCNRVAQVATSVLPGFHMRRCMIDSCSPETF